DDGLHQQHVHRLARAEHDHLELGAPDHVIIELVDDQQHHRDDDQLHEQYVHQHHLDLGTADHDLELDDHQQRRADDQHLDHDPGHHHDDQHPPVALRLSRGWPGRRHHHAGA